MRPAQGWDMMPADDADGHMTEGTDKRIGGPRTVAALLPRVTSTALRRRGVRVGSTVGSDAAAPDPDGPYGERPGQEP